MTEAVRDVTREQERGVAEPISSAIVDAVAAAAGVDPLELPPLNRSIDPDALDALFAPGVGDSYQTGTVECRHGDYEIRVVCDGDITITLAPDAAE